MLDTVRTYKMMLATHTKSIGAQKNTWYCAGNKRLISATCDVFSWLSCKSLLLSSFRCKECDDEALSMIKDNFH